MLYLAKVRARTGIFVRPMSEEMRHRRGTNLGVEVLEVVEGTSGFAADVLNGDIMVSVGGENVQSVDQYGQLIAKAEGTTTAFVFERDGKPYERQLAVTKLSP